MTMEIEALLDEVERVNGRNNQIIVCIEELSELQKELCKYLRVDADCNIEAISEEMADVQICLMMLNRVFNNQADVMRYKAIKLDRTKKRLNL